MNIPRHCQTAFCALVCSVVVLWIKVPCTAQANDARLNAPVHLRLGRTTVGDVAAAISKQTGLAVDAADYLSAHSITIQMDGLSARDALDAVVQIGGWRWRFTPPSGIIIDKLQAPKPVTLNEVSNAMQQALMPDVKTFLGIGQRVVASDIIERAKMADSVGASMVQWRHVYDKYYNISDILGRRLKSSLALKSISFKQAVDQMWSIKYSDLTAPRQEDVSAALLIYELGRCATDTPKSYALITGALSPLEIDPGAVTLTLSGNNLDFTIRKESIVGGQTVISTQGFGWRLDPSIPDEIPIRIQSPPK